MTHVHFEYSDAYGSGSRGSLAFTPHRRHAANETEVLPKPFTVPLLNGEVTVDLQPNPSTWVWIVTEYFEQQSESFYTTIPDSGGVVEAVDLIRINPSTIPAPYNTVEPAWWAEMRQYKQTVTKTLLESEEALSEAKEAIDIGQESIDRTQHNASLSKAYMEQSRESSYESRGYRDEAEQWRDEAQEQADRAASGPESAAQRSEDAAEASETSANQSQAYESDARNHAAEARADATTANESASQAVSARTEATSQADRSEREADRAKSYADEVMDGPREYVKQAEAARDAASNHADTASTEATSAGNARNAAAQHRDDAENYRDETQTIYQSTVDLLKPGIWYDVDFNTGFTGGSTPLQYMIEPGKLHLIGSFTTTDGDLASGDNVAPLPDGVTLVSSQRSILTTSYNEFSQFMVHNGGLSIMSDPPESTNTVWIHMTVYTVDE